MSGFKGTPGPWRVDPSHCGDVQTLDGQWEVACTSPLVLNGGECPDEWRANARLIAAAPELLALVQDLVRGRHKCFIPTADPELPTFDWDERAVRAIAKATGEQP